MLARARCCLCCSYKLAFLLYSLPRQEVLISLAVERSALPYDSSVRGPRKSLIFGESGGIERFQLAKRVLCASSAERDGTSHGHIQLLVSSFGYRTYQVVFGHLPWLQHHVRKTFDAAVLHRPRLMQLQSH